MSLYSASHLERADLWSLRGSWSFCRRLLGIALTLAAIALAAGFFYRDRIADEFGRLAVDAINRELAETGWHVELGGVSIQSPQWLSVHRVVLFAPQQTQPYLRLDQASLGISNPLEKGLSPQGLLEQILFDRSTLDVDLQAATAEDLEKLTRHLQRRPKRQFSLPVIRVRDAICKVRAPREISPTPLLFRLVHLQSAQEQQDLSTPNLRFTLRCESEYFKQALVKFRTDTQGAWDLALQMDGTRITENLLERLPLPPEWPASGVTHLGGTLDINAQVSAREGNVIPESLQARIEVRDLSLSHQNIHFPISNGQAVVSVHSDGLQVDEFQARLGDGQCELHYQQQGLLDRGDWLFWGRVDNLQVNQRLSAVLPPAGQKFFSDFAPVGLTSFQFRLGQQGNQTIKKCQASIHDLACTFHKFPYRLEHCVGAAFWDGNQCGFDIQALEGSQVVSIAGEVENPGPHSKFDIRFGCPGELPIDEKLFEALKLYPQIHRQVLAMKPRGRFGVAGRFYRPDPVQPPLLTYEITLQQCSVRHDRFDFQVRNINGPVKVEGTNVTFEHLTGENLSTAVTCDGTWSLSEGLFARFIASRVNLDEQLRHALPSMVKEAWDAIRPNGHIPLAKVDLRIPPDGGDMQVDVLLDARRPADAGEIPLSITPLAFPLEVQGISGLVTISDGRVTLREVRGRHGQTWIACNGSGSYSDRGWQLRIEDILTGALPVNSNLIAAFPESLQPSLERMKFVGNVHISGELAIGGHVVESLAAAERPPRGAVAKVSYEQDVETPSSRQSEPRLTETTLDWNLRIDTNDSRMNAGIDLTHIHGFLWLSGSYDGQRAYTEGQLKLDSITALGMQITNVEGPLWIDEQHVGAGLFAVPLGSQAHPKSLTGSLFGGQLHLDGQSWVEQKEKFYLQMTLASAQLNAAAACLAPSTDRIDGIGQLALRLSGDCDSEASLVGEGMIKMYNARIYELPVLLATLRQLRRFDEDNSAFDSCNIDFTVQGPKATIRRMELIGDPISLIGNGQVSWDREVDLDFYTVAGRNRFYIPMITELYEAGSQQILWVKVDGTLDAPRTHRRLMPVVNESLKELFQIQDF